MTKILGKSIATAKQMSEYLLSKNKTPKFSTNISVLDFCQLFLDVCAKEGVRGDIAFAQSCKETANFKYGGDVKYTQNNFAGIGATGGGVCGCIFSSIEEGILAQAQHLKTYATKDALNEPCVDPRRTTWFLNTKGGTSPDVETLGGTWAVPGYSTSKYSSLAAANAAKDSYGYQIIDIVNTISKINVKEEEKNMFKVYIDPGHYGSTYNKSTTGLAYYESAMTWKLAQYLKEELEARNVTVGLSRSSISANPSLYDRGYGAKGHDLFLSLHSNACGTESVDYPIVYRGYDKTVANDFAQKLANMIQKLMGTNQVGKVGTRTGDGGEYYGVLRGARAAGLTYYYIIEHSFHTNKNATAWLMSDANLKLLAKNEAQFIVDYFVNNKTSAPVVNTTTSSSSTNTTNSSSTSFTAGEQIALRSNNVYASSASTAKATKKSGTYYIWSNQVVNGRIRITNAKNRVGVAGQVSGWVNVSDFKSTTTTTTSTSTTVKGNYDLIFDATYYANSYPDLKAAFGTNATKLLNHFKTYGMKEGRQAISTFNVKVYKENNADLRNAFGNAGYEKYFEHYLQYGYKENRKCV